MSTSSHTDLIRHHSALLCQNGRLLQTKNYIQHGTTTVFSHVHQVAAIALKINQKWKLKANEDHLVRASLLHDYFLYDWHDKEHHHPRPHGFFHPYTALERIKEDFTLHPHEEDAVKRHMFPLIPVPPKHRVGWIVTLADKISAAKELKQYWKHKLRRKAVQNVRHS